MAKVVTMATIYKAIRRSFSHSSSDAVLSQLYINKNTIYTAAPMTISINTAIIDNAIKRSSCHSWYEELLSQSSGTMVLPIVEFDALN